MAWWTALLLLCAACGGPAFDDGDFACGPSGECPRGFACVQGECRHPTDAQPQDARPPDAGDAAEADAPDDARSIDASLEDACLARYGGAPTFMLCSTAPGSCTFYVATGDDSCTNLCASFGGTCLESWDEGVPSCTPATAGQSCTPLHSDQICQCSLP